MDHSLPASLNSPRPDASLLRNAEAGASSPFHGILLAVLLSLPVWLLIAWLIIRFG